MRDILFLSHANPDDNEFTLWLALKLVGEGYRVWCDLTGLLGGETTWMDINNLIREDTVKLVAVVSKSSNDRIGVLKELQLAENTARDNKLRDFIIPAHIDDLPYRSMNPYVVMLNAIAFENGWAKGLNILLEKLERDEVPKNPSATPEVVSSWWREHFSANQGVQEESEEYLSNWFPIENMPGEIHFHVLRRTSIGKIEIPDALPSPAFHEGEFLISFAGAEDFDGLLGEFLRIDRTVSFGLGEFLQGTAENKIVDRKQARDFIFRLLRMAWEQMIKDRKLPVYDLSNAQCFYFKKGLAEKDKAFFTGVDGERTFRNLVGYETKKNGKRYWHFGVQARPLTYPHFAYIIKPHVLFSDDGQNIWDSHERMHIAWRSQCKDWYNAEWRDRTLASMTWLAGEEGKIRLKLGNNVTVEIPSYPLSFNSPVSYIEPSKDQPHIEVNDEEDEDEIGDV
jgi:hypothetical protein